MSTIDMICVSDMGLGKYFFNLHYTDKCINDNFIDFYVTFHVNILLYMCIWIILRYITVELTTFAVIQIIFLQFDDQK